MEGWGLRSVQFYRYKTPHHPHTNMAKAALNMMTRTSAEDLATKVCSRSPAAQLLARADCEQGIYMNSVDTGWINDENPLEKAACYQAKSGFQTPIDEEDAAARILDPIFTGEEEEEEEEELSVRQA
eukprot:494546-Hanusia_phi.AAC.1